MKRPCLNISIRVLFKIVISRDGKALFEVLQGVGLVFLLTGCFERMNLPERDGAVDPSHEDVFQEDLGTDSDRPDAPDLSDDAARDEIPQDTGEDVQVDSFFCTPGDSWCTGAGAMATCNPDGTSYNEVACPLGCAETPDVHCLALIPSNVGDPSLLCVDGTGDMSLPEGTVLVGLNTGDGSITAFDGYGSLLGDVRAGGEGLVSGINFRTVAQPAGTPMLGVFSFGSFTVPPGVTVLGTGQNALVVLSCTDVSVQGRLGSDAIVVVVGGNEELLPGAGGGDTGAGAGAGSDGQTSGIVSGGGGGGGFGGAGGQGGITPNGGAGGLPYGNAELVPLLGGSGGGSGADNDNGGGVGGPSGGALQVSSGGTIHVFSGGAITASGWGGLGANPGGAGGGGGSGGGILLEAASIAVDAGGFVAANGGGGGATTVYSSSTDGEDGQPGQVGAMAALGGTITDPTNTCMGGNGNSSFDVNGATAPCTTNNGGGGGGGAGRIRLNAPAVGTPSGTVSPDLSTGAATTGLPVMQ